ncbi:MAG: hypothetical protein ACRCXT_11550 [Paraclostridium sp.]
MSQRVIDKSKVEELINKGYIKNQISKELEIPWTTLCKFIDKHNLSPKPRLECLVGKKFGKLTVLERTENDKDGKRVYICECECGNIKEIKAKYLINGDTRSCGCYKNFKKYQEKNYNEAYRNVGQKHGLLTIIDVEISSNKKYYKMVCRCECGKIAKRTYNSLLKYETPSCGCHAREMSSKRMSEDILDRFKGNKNKNWYFIKEGKIVYCRSGYEVIYANHLTINNIDFEYEPEHFKLGNGKRYTPDFYLVKEDRYIEIKGIPYEVLDKGNQKHSVELFRENHKLDIYYWEDLYNICDLPYKSYTNYRARANKFGIRAEDYLGKFLYLTY